ncbi:ABC transporter permease [Salinisphaera sp. SPP-AMP-43]|uniref:ABC transporter permease n=1 Tax=Salinisphaera sp. SPP-AMP-43 TaxID=3121288 RepID=UPI003C6EA336
MTAIARLECARLFASPLAWVLLGATQLLAGLLFVMSLTDVALNPDHLNAYDGVSELVGAGLFRFVTLILLLVVPLLTMRAFAEERKTGTLELLLAAPASATEIVLGKFIGVMLYLSLSWALIALMPLTLLIFTPLDLGVIAAGLIGLWLVMASFAAIGVFASALTHEPTLAAVLSLAGLMLLWLIYAVASLDWQPTLWGWSIALGSLARGVSPIGHADTLLRGIVASGDIAYFLIFVAAFLGLAVVRVDADRRG